MTTELNRFLRHAVPFRSIGGADEGRDLPHPEAGVEDRGLRFDVVTALSRRGPPSSFGGASGVAEGAPERPAEELPERPSGQSPGS